MALVKISSAARTRKEDWRAGRRPAGARSFAASPLFPPRWRRSKSRSTDSEPADLFACRRFEGPFAGDLSISSLARLRSPSELLSRLPNEVTRTEWEGRRLSGGRRPVERVSSLSKVSSSVRRSGGHAPPRVRRVSPHPTAIWLILPVAICLSQRLSHACPSTRRVKVKPRMAH